jgi:hypothetical protein
MRFRFKCCQEQKVKSTSIPDFFRKTVFLPCKGNTNQAYSKSQNTPEALKGPKLKVSSLFQKGNSALFAPKTTIGKTPLNSFYP